MIRQWKSFDKPPDFERNLINWANKAEFGFCFNGAGWGSRFQFDVDVFSGVGVDEEFSGTANESPSFLEGRDDFIIAHFNYDVKNHFEALESANIDAVGFPECSLIIPKVVVLVQANMVRIGWNHKESDQLGDRYLSEILEQHTSDRTTIKQASSTRRISDKQYLSQLDKIKHHIKLGDIYQANYCQEYYWSDIEINEAELYFEGFRTNPNPFSVLYKLRHHACLSWSPERFLSFEGQKVTSQPMKGTAKRHRDSVKDQQQYQTLRNSEKDRRENVMIVDMVRNDLGRTAIAGSVKVPELYVIETYPKVHQMYSTVTAERKTEFNLLETLLTSFPMGSMTGAPKIRAMQIIEELEYTKRGLFSGTIGFITPEKNADFNVVIRSLIYNKKTKYLSAFVGGGITDMSDPNQELEECKIKILPILELMNRLSES